MQYWRFRPSFPQQTTVLALSPGSKSPVKSTSISKSAISVIDAGYELWILCPSTLDSEKASLAAALDVSQGLASSWQSRSLPYRPPQHVLVFPSALPRDLPHLSRQLDILALVRLRSPPPWQSVTLTMKSRTKGRRRLRLISSRFRRRGINWCEENGSHLLHLCTDGRRVANEFEYTVGF
jgi:hypothetical protein